MNVPISFDLEKCVGCKLCVKECPIKVIKVDRRKKAHFVAEKCLECGHCFAVCPQNAVIMNNFNTRDLDEIGEDNFVDSEKLMQHLMARRTIRQYSDKVVDMDTIKKIIEAGRYSPTGVNKQDVRYVVLQRDVDLFENEALKQFEKLQKVSKVAGKVVKLPYDLSQFNLKKGFMFKGAPIVILVVSTSVVDGTLAIMNMELMAESLGLGTLYTGLFVRAVKVSKKLKSMIGLRKNEKVVMGLAIGYSDVKFTRIAPKKEANIVLR